jgi:hypothetical protein
MARGWESKSVEAQQDERERSAREGRQPAPTPVEAERAARRRTLELALARAQADLANARSPAHRVMLERTITAVTDELGGDGARNVDNPVRKWGDRGRNVDKPTSVPPR